MNTRETCEKLIAISKEQMGVREWASHCDPQIITRLCQRLMKLEDALGKLSKGWLYWEAKRQPDPRTTMYESKTLDQIEAMAREALRETESE